MKQPTVLVDGVEYKVKSIWWNNNESIAHFSVNLTERLETFFPYEAEGKWFYIDVDRNRVVHSVEFVEEVTVMSLINNPYNQADAQELAIQEDNNYQTEQEMIYDLVDAYAECYGDD